MQDLNYNTENQFSGGKLTENNVWWVNQGKSINKKKNMDYLWAPLRSENGRKIYSWEPLKDVKIGDIVIHYANGAIRYVSRVVNEAVVKSKPEELGETKNWEDKGRYVEVEPYKLEPPIELKAFSNEIRKFNIDKGPLDKNGNVIMGYMFNLTRQALAIIQKAQPETEWPEFAQLDINSVTNFNNSVEAKNIKEKIINDIKSYSKSYKFILYKGFFELAKEGQIMFDELTDYFKNFYLERKNKGLPVEDKNAVELIRNINHDTSLEKIKTHIKNLPLKYSDFLNIKYETVYMEPKYWDTLSEKDKKDILSVLDQTIYSYYQNLPGVDDIIKAENIFLVVGDEKNFPRTIEGNVNLGALQDVLSESNYNRLKEIYPSGEFNCWGFQDNKTKTRCWDKMTYGDLCLMYLEGNIVMSGIVTYTLHNKEMALEIWQLGDQPLEFIFCLTDIHLLDIPSKKVLIDEFGYDVPNIRGGMRLAGHRLDNVIKKHGSIEEFRRYIEGDQFIENEESGIKEENPEELEREESEPIPENIKNYNVKEILGGIKAYIRDQGFFYPEGLIENFYLSLKTKPFVLLAGISGTGKTKLVELFAEAIGCTRANKRFELISVRPDWNDSTDLLGYKNIKDIFIPGPMIDVIKRANDNLNKPYIVCLDEMNLARVEYYFSDFLSKMETRKFENGRIRTTELLSENDFAENDKNRERYSGVYISENLYIVGTVNMDETTHPFSKKVLDRANTIEFTDVNLGINANEFSKPGEHSPHKLNNNFLKSNYLLMKDCITENIGVTHGVATYLVGLNEILKKAYLHVGYRIRDEISFYMSYAEQSNILDFKKALDYQIMQKILPRIQGSSALIKEVLVDLFEYAGGQGISTKSGDLAEEMAKQVRNVNFDFPLTAAKVAFMVERLEADGFTAYWL